MLFDSYKRQEKEKSIEEMIEEHKVKINEEERIKAFNRLIDDANKRIEIQQFPSKEESEITLANINQGKKYKKNDWNEIYHKRFMKHEVKKKEKIDKKASEQAEKKLYEEDQIIESLTMKKDKVLIKKLVNRMAEDAERRKANRLKNVKMS